MKDLVIFAHPLKESHSGVIFEEVVKGLKRQKRDFEVVDLYDIKYDPVVWAEDYPRPQPKLDKQDKEFQKKITEAKRLIFIYPVWWGGLPAILKGWIDRTFTAGFAFTYENGKPQGLLKKKALIYITSGAPSFVQWFIGFRYTMGMKHDILKFCGIKAKAVLFGSCRRIDEKRKEIRKRVRETL